MKKILFFIIILLISTDSISQQIPFYQIKAKAEKEFEIKYNRNAKLDAENLIKINKTQEIRLFDRWAFWAERHLDNNGFVKQEFDYNKTAIDFFDKNEKNLKVDATQSIGGNWSNLPITNYSSNGGIQGGIGRVNCIVEIPGTFDVLVGTAGGGIWRGYKLQNGYNWACLSNNIPQLGVADIAINPTNANEIVIATGSGYGGGASSGGTSIGILKSVDGGNNWAKTAFVIKDSLSINIYKIAVDPNNFQNMILATNAGLYRTNNGFATFPDSVPNTLNGITATGGLWYDIKFKPNDSNTIYASSISGVWRSINAGASFQNIYNIPIPTNASCNRVMLGVSNNNPDLVYALAGNDGKSVVANTANSKPGFIGLFKSTNSGGSFSTASTSPNILSNQTNGTNGDYFVADYALSIDVSPTNQNRIIVGSLNTWESLDGGITWVLRSDNGSQFNSPAYVHADIHFLKYNSFGNVFAGTDGGYFHLLFSNFNTWTFESMGINVTQFYRLSIHNQTNFFSGYTGRVIYGGSQDNGQHRWRTTDFTKVLSGDGMDNAIASATGINVIAASQYGNIAYSDNYGSTFSAPDTPPSQNGTGSWITPIVQHSLNPETVYAGFKNIQFTDDGGEDWDYTLNTGFANNIIAMDQGVYYTINGTNNVIYAATDLNTIPNTAADYNLFRFENENPNTKTDITGPFNNNLITSIATDPVNSRYVFVTLGGYDPLNKIFFSSNRGQTWTNLTSNLPNVPVHCVTLKDGGGTGIYIGTDIGVFHRFSFAGGEKWTLFSNKLPNVAVLDLELDIPNNEIFAATYGRGLWKSDMYTLCAPSLTHNEWSVGQEYYEVSGTINSSAIITGGFGSKVTYNAGQEIVFGDGFVITDGSAMNAYIGGCGQVRNDDQFLRKSAETPLQIQNGIPSSPKIQKNKLLTPK